MNRSELLDLYFLEARAKVIDLAAFLDRMNRAEGDADFRFHALKQGLAELQSLFECAVERRRTPVGE